LLPTHFALEQNYPNPFNPTTTISYELPHAANVSLKIYDIIGREVVSLVEGLQAAGYHEVTLNGRDFSSGLYFYRLIAGTFVDTKKMLYVK